MESLTSQKRRKKKLKPSFAVVKFEAFDIEINSLVGRYHPAVGVGDDSMSGWMGRAGHG